MVPGTHYVPDTGILSAQVPSESPERGLRAQLPIDEIAENLESIT
jgi:hypothetical protein